MTHVESVRDRALKLLHHAVLAPSSHNTQPWQFRVNDDHIDLIADRTRALPVNDPDDRELTISCGCALMNLRVAAAAAGLGPELRLLPDPDDPDWLARVLLHEGAGSAAPDAALLPFVARRRTYRSRFRPEPVGEDLVAPLADAARVEGAWLRPCLGEEIRSGVTALVGEGDAVQWSNPSWRRELAAWMHPRRRGDGLAVPGLAVPAAQLVVRTFDMGRGVAARDRDVAAASPLLAVLGTPGDDVHEWLVAGQALERVLLTACGLGLQASYLNQPIQVASLRPRLQQLLSEAGSPQILLRLGYPITEPTPAPRRPVEDVVE